MKEKEDMVSKSGWTESIKQGAWVCAQSSPTLCDSVAHQAPLSMRFFRQGYWSGLPFPPPGKQGAESSIMQCKCWESSSKIFSPVSLLPTFSLGTPSRAACQGVSGLCLFTTSDKEFSTYEVRDEPRVSLSPGSGSPRTVHFYWVLSLCQAH